MAIPYSRTVLGSLPWYSVLVVFGIVLAIWLAGREEKRLGLPKDTTVDLALTVVPFGIAGARLYYVMMSWESFAPDPLKVFYIWEGGLAIYGAVIGGAVGAGLYAWRKKISFAVLADMIAPGLLLAQAVGRWGNYFNMEAYGPAITDPRLQFFPLAVLIPSSTGYDWHAATFFYESAWNALGFAALWLLRQKQKQKGNVFAWYLLIYGSGRFIIEQLREDSLYIGRFRASQYLSLALCAISALLLLWRAFNQNKKGLIIAILCSMLWLARWAVLEEHLLYAGIMLVSGITAIWLKRNGRIAICWLAAAVVMDGFGLMTATFLQSAVIGAALHALLCSITLPMDVYALCLSDE